MAKNTGSGYRKGAVKERSQVDSSGNNRYTKRDAATGRFIAQKADDQPFKGVRKEKGDEGNDKK
jgi:hypothetical protein